jgi:hypothetical protein
LPHKCAWTPPPHFKPFAPDALKKEFTLPIKSDEKHESPRSALQASYELALLGFTDDEIKEFYAETFEAVGEEMKSAQLRFSNNLKETPPRKLTVEITSDKFCFMGTQITFKDGDKDITPDILINWPRMEADVYIRLVQALETKRTSQPALLSRPDMRVGAPDTHLN